MIIQIIVLAIGLGGIGIIHWMVRYNYSDRRQLEAALELSADLSSPLFVYQDKEDWRISLGEATHPKYGRVKFQTMGVLVGSVKLQIMDLLGHVLEERPLIVA